MIEVKQEKKLTDADLRAVFMRSNLFQGSWNFERMQALGFCFSMVPVIRRLYPEKSAERKQAIKRHLEFFNTHPYVVAPIFGVVSAMEEQRANGAEIDDAAINGIKVGLMGPLAGVGDPIFWGTVRPVFAALGAGIAMTGSILGPLLFFVLFNLVRLFTRYWGVTYGYKKGIDIVGEMGGGLLQKLTEGASILGLFVMGALVNKWTKVNIPLVVSNVVTPNFEATMKALKQTIEQFAGVADSVNYFTTSRSLLAKTAHLSGDFTTTTLQNILDQLMPGLVPLLLTFGCMWLLRNKVNALRIIMGFFVIGILGYWLGLLA